MKRTTIWVAATVVLLLTAFVLVRAETRGRHGWCGHRWHHPGPASYLAHELKLNDAQRAQIQTLWQAERPALSAHLHELLAENKEMNAITVQENPDPGTVQQIAEREAATVAVMLVEKERLQAKVFQTVLHPDQRAKAEELEKKLESRLDHAADRLGTQPAQK
ncbi:MAG TPA: periplasmic heavy metal sensor [Acidobacteriaceae bacterium]